MGVALTSAVLEMGLGGRIRDILQTQAHGCACWPLRELYSSTAADISGNSNHGTFTGSGFTRGVVHDVPEGALGLTFDGNGYIRVPDDTDNVTNQMSMAGGSMDVSFFIKTSTNDGTLRAIVQKQLTNSSGNGWHCALQSGAIVFYLEVAGTTVFNFSRGSVSDNAWHQVHCFYDPAIGKARIYIDGAQSGAEVSSVTTEPVYQAVDLLIGTFTDLAGDFIGSLSYVSLSREGDATLAGRLHAARSWTNISADVRVTQAPITASLGLSGSHMTDLTASSGRLTCDLDNSAKNSGSLEGYYSPGHANARAGFVLGAPVRLRYAYGGVTKYKWRGALRAVTPVAGSNQNRLVSILCTDWFDSAAQSPIIGAPTLASQTSDVAIKALIDEVDDMPSALSLQTGSQTFAYALDQGRADHAPALAELGRVCRSEFGYLYTKGDTAQGGTLTYESRYARQASAALAATFTNSMHGLDVEYAKDAIINQVDVSVYPPSVDTSTITLYTLLASATITHLIKAGATLIINAAYSDPNDRTSNVGGTSLITPVATTDYTANSAADGTGTNYTTSLSIVSTLGASALELEITNNAAVDVYLTKLQVRGYGVYRYTESIVTLTDWESRRQHGLKPLRIDMPYQNSAQSGTTIGEAIIARYAEPEMRPLKMHLKCNQNSTLMTQALAREIGDRIGIVESVSGLVAGNGYYINHEEVRLWNDRRLEVTYTLSPAFPPALLLTYTGASEGTVSLDERAAVLTVSGNYTFTFNRTGDTIRIKGTAGGGAGGKGTTLSGGGGGGGGAVDTIGETTTVTTSAVGGYTGKVGAGGVPGSPSTAGGTTEFMLAASTVYLRINGGGLGVEHASAPTGGAGGTVTTGANAVAGAAGGAGGVQGVSAAVAGSNGATGGGGGGAPTGQTAAAGGNGTDQNGGAGGNQVAGTDASGQGGQIGSASPGGGGGGGGGRLLSLGYRGGGGGGGGAGTSVGGAGGAGNVGCLVISKE